MGWLEDLSKDTIYIYNSTSAEDPCNSISGTLKQLKVIFGAEVKGEPGEILTCFQTSYKYGGFEPKKLGLMTKVTFEKNGRKAIRTLHPDGKQSVRSMTRENLLKGRGVRYTGDKRDATGEKTGKKSYEVESSLSRGCKEASIKAKAEIFHGRLNHMKQEIEAANHNKKK